MLADKRQHIRELAVEKILKGQGDEKSSTIRKFDIPKLNFHNIINWQATIAGGMNHQQQSLFFQ